MPVDWDKIHEEWDKAPEDLKKRVAELFREKTKEKLAELFRKEPMAGYVYEEATGEAVTEVHVKLKVNTDETPGEYFYTFLYDTFEVGFGSVLNTPFLVELLESEEEFADFTEQYVMAGLEPEEVDEHLKELPWPFNTGMRIRIYWKYPDDVEFTEKAKEQWDIYHYTYSRVDLEAMKVDELRRISQIKGVKVGKTKEEMIANILGIPVAPPPPPVPPPAPPVAPPPKPPVVAPPPVEVRGLQKADEDYLRDVFTTRLKEGTFTPSRAREHLDEFRIMLRKLREDVKDLPRSEAVKRGERHTQDLADTILVRYVPAVRPPPPIVVRPPEEVPPVVPVVRVPPVAPPPGVERRWGMPWSYHLCPACLGEERETVVLRSPYVEVRLRALGVPTTDSLFFELCDDHRQKYGGAFEHFPRYVTEFWVGEVLHKAEIDIATLVGMGISEEYAYHCLRFYREHRHLAVQ